MYWCQMDGQLVHLVAHGEALTMCGLRNTLDAPYADGTADLCLACEAEARELWGLGWHAPIELRARWGA